MPRHFINLEQTFKQVWKIRTFAFAILLYGNETGTKYGQFGGSKLLMLLEAACTERRIIMHQ
jgi:hypothetical protein